MVTAAAAAAVGVMPEQQEVGAAWSLPCRAPWRRLRYGLQ